MFIQWKCLALIVKKRSVKHGRNNRMNDDVFWFCIFLLVAASYFAINITIYLGGVNVW